MREEGELWFESREGSMHAPGGRAGRRAGGPGKEAGEATN